MDVTSVFLDGQRTANSPVQAGVLCSAVARRQQSLPMERTWPAHDPTGFLMAGRWEFMLRVCRGACLCNAGGGLLPGSHKSPRLYVQVGLASSPGQPAGPLQWGQLGTQWPAAITCLPEAPALPWSRSHFSKFCNLDEQHRLLLCIKRPF